MAYTVPILLTVHTTDATVARNAAAAVAAAVSGLELDDGVDASLHPHTRPEPLDDNYPTPVALQLPGDWYEQLRYAVSDDGNNDEEHDILIQAADAYPTHLPLYDEDDDTVRCCHCGSEVCPDPTGSVGVWVHDASILGDDAYDLNSDHAALPPENVT